MSVTVHNLGFPRVGKNRELKFAEEKFWKGDLAESALLETAQNIRAENWKLQQEAGIKYIPSNDFSFYDQVLDHSCLFGAIPERYGFTGDNVDLETYFRCARGKISAENNACHSGCTHQETTALEMTKWFDTNYHYLVPEFDKNQKFSVKSSKIIDEYLEAKSLGIETTPVILGPLTYLYLGKTTEDFNRFDLLDDFLEVYVAVLQKLKAAGIRSIQIDEPIFSFDLDAEILAQYPQVYAKIRETLGDDIEIIVANYFGDLDAGLETFFGLPADIFHVDLVRGAAELDAILENFPAGKKLSAGVVNGRNIWKNDYDKSLVILEKIVAKIGKDNLIVSPSCSLLHSPVTLEEEDQLDTDLRNWLAFATEKLGEISDLAEILNNGENTSLADNRAALESRRTSEKIHVKSVKERVAGITPQDFERASKFEIRQPVQHKALGQVLFPTTSIGSFPQTPEVRQNRAKFRKGDITLAEYYDQCREFIKDTIKIQEDLDLDFLVHGEFERNDMVEYFGEEFEGFAFTKKGWVQSYGSRCVKPPIIFGDVSRPKAVTVEWSRFAQDQTDRVMKGMLTGPITILQWSFVRDDQPRKDTTFQIALALRDEVVDLEAAGIKAIQIDEPALREGLPLRRNDWSEYLDWSVKSFQLSAAGVRDETQIHTHMCYCDFNDVIDSIAALDADVISIEASRSEMELLKAFDDFHYPNEIGPGTWDIHSPRVPSVEEQVDLLEKALQYIPKKNLWVNPDCGLKTRTWPETLESLKNLVAAAKILRERYA